MPHTAKSKFGYISNRDPEFAAGLMAALEEFEYEQYEKSL